MPDDKKSAIKDKLTAVREATLRAVETLTDAQWDSPAGDGEGGAWRAIDVLRHVTDSERGMTGLMAQLQAGGEGVPADFDLERWNRRVVTKMQDKGVAELKADMAANRQALFAFIDTLAGDDWAKQGRHASGRILSIEQVCHLIADHEEAHVAEIGIRD